MIARRVFAVLCVLVVGAGCRAHETPSHNDGRASESTITVHDSEIPSVLEAAGVAEPLRSATLSTKLMGSVTEFTAREGQRVNDGQVLARIDARDVAAQRMQTEAAVAAAQAVEDDAERQANRMRALYADSAAPKVQLEAAEVGLTRAAAGVRTARAAAEGVDALETYATIRAPFTGLVTRRFVDPGGFVAPGTPIATVQDASHLRVIATVSPSAVRGLRRGDRIEATIEGTPVTATVEGVVPAVGSALSTVNALVDNPNGRLITNGAATLTLPEGVHTGIMMPESVLVREGDLTGVRVRGAAGPELRWLRVGRVEHGVAEVLSGLKTGDQVIIPVPIGRER
jgi:RND family efflux transporter MFP subunit